MTCGHDADDPWSFVVVAIASMEFWTRLRMTSRSCPLLPWITGNSDANIVWAMILWSSSSLRSSCIASSANAFMSTGLVFLLASPEQAEKAFEHFVRTKGGIFYLVKEPLCRASISGDARSRNRRPAAACEVMPDRGCLTSWAIAATTASALVSLFSRSRCRFRFAIESLAWSITVSESSTINTTFETSQGNHTIRIKANGEANLEPTMRSSAVSTISAQTATISHRSSTDFPRDHKQQEGEHIRQCDHSIGIISQGQNARTIQQARHEIMSCRNDRRSAHTPQ